MHKTQLGPVSALYPSLTTIVGTQVDGRPNWLTIAHVGIMNHGKPMYLSVSLNRKHYSTPGIIENGTFSINIPSREMLIVTDFVGLVSGRNTDKSELFETFYGELETAPMIAECPLCMELRLKKTFAMDAHDVFVGEVVQTYADDAVLKDGKIDYAKADPILFDFQRVKYWSLGEEIGVPWNEGKAMKNAV
ncbi:MAG: flavin reductase family protein [Desulfovibrio sp.]|uniref:flavin reductase family protein n=1 Tax=Desulfovibrio sp. 7SRBS1 TaxID=3378064 RepID=UPI003B41B5DA